MKSHAIKKYVPKSVLADPLSWARAGVYLIPTHIKQDLKAHIEQAYTLMAQGKADRDVWCTLMQSLNIGEELCRLRICNDRWPEIDAAQNSLVDIAKRMLDGNATCKGAELTIIREGLDMHRIQINECTQAEFSKSVKQVMNRTKSAKAAEYPGAEA